MPEANKITAALDRPFGKPGIHLRFAVGKGGMKGGLERTSNLPVSKGGSETNFLGNFWPGDEPARRKKVDNANDVWSENPSHGHNVAPDYNTLR